jgi:hypothetical protein
MGTYSFKLVYKESNCITKAQMGLNRFKLDFKDSNGFKQVQTHNFRGCLVLFAAPQFFVRTSR